MMVLTLTSLVGKRNDEPEGAEIQLQPLLLSFLHPS